VSIDVSSSAFADGGTIPERYSLLGGNVSPPLSWSGVPEDAVELAVLMQDPDAPSGTFTHWIVAGLAPSLDRLDEGALPAGAVEGGNDFGEEGYGGPCPPPGHGRHRYVFRMLALDTELTLERGAGRRELERAMEGHVLGAAQLTGGYARHG
jgi:Raf kinase inhibitor-like YbhB/YbcL family protein